MPKLINLLFSPSCIRSPMLTSWIIEKADQKRKLYKYPHATVLENVYFYIQARAFFLSVWGEAHTSELRSRLLSVSKLVCTLYLAGKVHIGQSQWGIFELSNIWTHCFCPSKTQPRLRWRGQWGRMRAGRCGGGSGTKNSKGESGSPLEYASWHASVCARPNHSHHFPCRGLQKDYRTDRVFGTDVPCWFVHNSGKGFIDGHYKDYFVPQLYSFLQWP